MVFIQEQYDDDRIIQELRKRRPELNLGDVARIVGVDAGNPTANADRTIELTLQFAVSKEEWREILAASIL